MSNAEEIAKRLLFDKDMTSKLEDLRDSLKNRWCRWSDWERDFIRSVASDIPRTVLFLTAKQTAKIIDMWERI